MTGESVILYEHRFVINKNGEYTYSKHRYNKCIKTNSEDEVCYYKYNSSCSDYLDYMCSDNTINKLMITESLKYRYFNKRIIAESLEYHYAMENKDYISVAFLYTTDKKFDIKKYIKDYYDNFLSDVTTLLDDHITSLDDTLANLQNKKLYEYSCEIQENRKIFYKKEISDYECIDDEIHIKGKDFYEYPNPLETISNSELDKPIIHLGYYNNFLYIYSFNSELDYKRLFTEGFENVKNNKISSSMDDLNTLIKLFTEEIDMKSEIEKKTLYKYSFNINDNTFDKTQLDCFEHEHKNYENPFVSLYKEYDKYNDEFYGCICYKHELDKLIQSENNINLIQSEIDTNVYEIYSYNGDLDCTSIITKYFNDIKNKLIKIFKNNNKEEK